MVNLELLLNHEIYSNFSRVTVIIFRASNENKNSYNINLKLCQNNKLITFKCENQ